MKDVARMIPAAIIRWMWRDWKDCKVYPQVAFCECIELLGLESTGEMAADGGDKGFDAAGEEVAVGVGGMDGWYLW